MKKTIHAAMCAFTLFWAGAVSSQTPISKDAGAGKPAFFEVDQKIIGKYKIIVSAGNPELIFTQILATPEGPVRVAHILMALSVALDDINLTTRLASLFFHHSVSPDQVNVTHLRLLCDVYLAAASGPHKTRPPRRGVLSIVALQLRLLDYISSILDVEEQRFPLPQDLYSIDYLRLILKAAAEKASSSPELKGEIQHILPLLDSVKEPVHLED